MNSSNSTLEREKGLARETHELACASYSKLDPRPGHELAWAIMRKTESKDLLFTLYARK